MKYWKFKINYRIFRIYYFLYSIEGKINYGNFFIFSYLKFELLLGKNEKKLIL